MFVQTNQTRFEIYFDDPTRVEKNTVQGKSLIYQYIHIFFFFNYLLKIVSITSS